MFRLALSFASFLALWPPPAVAQTPALAASATVARRSTLEQVTVIGASLSSGYKAAPGWGAAFEASLARAGEVASNHASERVFLSLERYALPQAELAFTERPTLVLAIDYLFWFGYGTTDAERSLAQLERGLESLERFECPIVIGDFPSMSAAVGKILSIQQMPEPETLARLNARLGEWAASRENVVVLGLSKWVKDLDEGKEIRIGARAYPPEVAKSWRQPDQLHPTIEGLAALATLVHHELEARKLVAAADYHGDAAKVLERVRAAAPSEAPAGAK